MPIIESCRKHSVACCTSCNAAKILLHTERPETLQTSHCVPSMQQCHKYPVEFRASGNAANIPWGAKHPATQYIQPKHPVQRRLLSCAANIPLRVMYRATLLSSHWVPSIQQRSTYPAKILRQTPIIQSSGKPFVAR